MRSDQVLDWHLVAGWLAPALSCISASGFRNRARGHRRWMTIAIYAPGAVLTLIALGFGSAFLRLRVFVVAVRDVLDRCWLALLTVTYIASGVVLQVDIAKSEDTVVRQQLKWLRNGILFGFTPFGILYAMPYVVGTYIPRLSLSELRRADAAVDSAHHRICNSALSSDGRRR